MHFFLLLTFFQLSEVLQWLRGSEIRLSDDITGCKSSLTNRKDVHYYCVFSEGRDLSQRPTALFLNFHIIQYQLLFHPCRYLQPGRVKFIINLLVTNCFLIFPIDKQLEYITNVIFYLLVN